ncbi:MAG: riboflavin synthase [Terriglobia bacterium]
MFSGIVETTRPVLRVRESRGQREVWIRTPARWRLRPGESVCVEGVCSTVQESKRNAFRVIYMPESVRRTTLSTLEPGMSVNLERSLKLNSLIGGHIVQGHVDGTARVVRTRPEGSAKIFEFQAPPSLTRYIVEKGSIAVDGISLTVAGVRRNSFSVSVLEYTLNHTSLGTKDTGSRVNLEADILAKYAEKLLKR